MMMGNPLQTHRHGTRRLKDTAVMVGGAEAQKRTKDDETDKGRKLLPNNSSGKLGAARAHGSTDRGMGSGCSIRELGIGMLGAAAHSRKSSREGRVVRSRGDKQTDGETRTTLFTALQNRARWRRSGPRDSVCAPRPRPTDPGAF